MENRKVNRPRRDGEGRPTVSVNIALVEDGAIEPRCTTLTGHGAACLTVMPGENDQSYRVGCSIKGSFSMSSALAVLETALDAFEANIPGFAQKHWDMQLKRQLGTALPDLLRKLANEAGAGGEGD